MGTRTIYFTITYHVWYVLVKYIVRLYECLSYIIHPKSRLISEECSMVCMPLPFLHLQENDQSTAQLNSKRSKTLWSYVHCIYYDCTSIIVSRNRHAVIQSTSISRFWRYGFLKNSLLRHSATRCTRRFKSTIRIAYLSEIAPRTSSRRESK